MNELTIDRLRGERAAKIKADAEACRLREEQRLAEGVEQLDQGQRQADEWLARADYVDVERCAQSNSVPPKFKAFATTAFTRGFRQVVCEAYSQITSAEVKRREHRAFRGGQRGGGH